MIEAQILMEIPAFIKVTLENIPYAMISEILVILVGTCIISLFTSRAINRLTKSEKDHRHYQNSIFLTSIQQPLKIAIWLVAITLILDVLNNNLKMNILKFSSVIRTTGSVLLLTWIILSLISTFKDKVFKGTHHPSILDKYTVDLVSKILKAATLAIASLIILESLGFSISGIIAVGGIGGAAIAFASQNMLSNFFGTMTLYLDKPFVIGENISINEGNIKGIVEDIGWRSTLLKTSENLSLYVPNSLFTKSSITNLSRYHKKGKKLSEKIGVEVSSSAATFQIINDIQAILEASPYVDQDQNISVVFSNFGHNFIEISLGASTNITVDEKFALARQVIMLEIFDVITLNGIKIIFSNENKQILSSQEIK